MSYQPPEMLYVQLAMGHPVIVWTCFDYNVTEIKYNEVVLDDGTVFTILLKGLSLLPILLMEL